MLQDKKILPWMWFNELFSAQFNKGQNCNIQNKHQIYFTNELRVDYFVMAENLPRLIGLLMCHVRYFVFIAYLRLIDVDLQYSFPFQVTCDWLYWIAIYLQKRMTSCGQVLLAKWLHLQRNLSITDVGRIGFMHFPQALLQTERALPQRTF